MLPKDAAAAADAAAVVAAADAAAAAAVFLVCLTVHKHIRTSLATTIAASEPTSLTTHAVASGPPLESINYMPIGRKMLAVLRPMAARLLQAFSSKSPTAAGCKPLPSLHGLHTTGCKPSACDRAGGQGGGGGEKTPLYNCRQAVAIDEDQKETPPFSPPKNKAKQLSEKSRQRYRNNLATSLASGTLRHKFYYILAVCVPRNVAIEVEKRVLSALCGPTTPKQNLQKRKSVMDQSIYQTCLYQKCTANRFCLARSKILAAAAPLSKASFPKLQWPQEPIFFDSRHDLYL